MVTIRLSGGLGNQLFQYAAARSLSIYRKTSLLIDLEEYRDSRKRSYSLGYFTIESKINSKLNNELKDDSKIKKKIKFALSKLNLYIPLPINYYFDHTWRTNFNFYNLPDNVTLEGSFANLFYFDKFRECLIKELQLKDNFLSSDFTQYLEKIESTNSVSIHIHRGDYVEENNFFCNLNNEYYSRCYKYVNSHLHQKNICFFIFSDDIAWVKQNLVYLINPVINLKSAVSYSQNFHFVENLPDYQDLILMSSCKHNIIANSTFSWWAAYLNKNRNKIVLYPYKWYTKEKLNNKKRVFLPTDWIEIK